jgi:hypothetical protein
MMAAAVPMALLAGMAFVPLGRDGVPAMGQFRMAERMQRACGRPRICLR